ncbi:lipoate--protein ligase family protein [Brevibacillus sp. B_LB10_24]|uniref:lipoate--protein ligase family protein n=1 Tax=Brevibacillus sp. B_LB10_24 TaxID=3380645 RepID=UPI0038BA7EB4
MDSGIHTANPIDPLAFDEALANSLGKPGALPIIHLWIYDRALYLGRRDARLPYLSQGLKFAAERGFGCVLRSSGGACVPLDAGVLNVAILLPDTRISIDDFFRLSAAIISTGLESYGPVEIGEVAGSYCAGDYDFAISGKKLGGMAQRRTRHGSILQLCINVEGSGLERGELMDNFYREAGLAEMLQNKPIPWIDPATIGSLSELTGRSVTLSEAKEHLLAACEKFWAVEKVPFSLPVADFSEARTHLTERLGLYGYSSEELKQADSLSNS